jgi:hypothetical protein
MSAWRQIWYGFVGNLIFTLFAGVCTALGVGPNRWVEFLMGGIPITPGVVRLAFLLLASLTLVSLFWQKIVFGQLAAKLALIGLASLPFVAGAFYITASPQADRALSQEEYNTIITDFSLVSSEFQNNIPVQAAIASPDAAGYGLQFMSAFHMAGLRVNGIDPHDNNPPLFPTPVMLATSQMRGLYIGVQSGLAEADIPSKALLFQKTLKKAGFDAYIRPWGGLGKDEFCFAVGYR